MPSITLTVLITAIVVAHSPITVDSSPPPYRDPTRDRAHHSSTPSSSPLPPPSPSPSKPLGPSIRSPPPQPSKPVGPSPPLPTTPNRPPHQATPPDPGRGMKQPTRKTNLGRKIGYVFVGMAGLLQVAVVGFLGFKRWQISNIKENLADSPA